MADLLRAKCGVEGGWGGCFAKRPQEGVLQYMQILIIHLTVARNHKALDFVILIQMCTFYMYSGIPSPTFFLQSSFCSKETNNDIQVKKS